MSELEDRLAAALMYATHHAHPVYANTSRHGSGIGGQSMTQGCSFIDPPPGEEWLQYSLLDKVLHEYLAQYPEAPLNDNSKALAEELKKELNG